MFPKAAENPDILINAYSTNDMHHVAVKGDLQSEQLSALQSFARFVLKRNDLSGRCTEKRIPQILYLHLNDYIGNRLPQILDTMAVGKSNSVLASYYGYASASYADIVRDYAYGDTNETFFTAPWYANGQMRREGMFIRNQVGTVECLRGFSKE